MTRPAKRELPPCISSEAAPGYIEEPLLGIFVYIEDYHLVFDVYEELNQYRFEGKRHGTRHLKNQGCKGPLCRKAQRDHVRAADLPPTEVYRRRWARYDDLLARLQAYHEEVLASKSKESHATHV